MERLFVGVLPWLGVGLVAALPLLAVDVGDDLLAASVVHVAFVVALGLAAALVLAPLADEPGWFADWAPLLRRFASAAAVVAVVTGMVGLVTLATGAALRFDPSLQLLQLLGALDIAWAATAIVVGAMRGWGRRAAVVAGSALAIVCVWAIWNYLDTVGFSPSGGWVVDGGELMRLVIPYDVAAAVVALATVALGTVRSQPIEQLSPQS